jgi:hypothetical protein
MFCPNCGKTINDGDKFCANCSFRTDGLFQQQNNFQNVPINYQPQNIQPSAPAEEKGHPVAIFFTTMIIGCGLLAGAMFIINPGILKNNSAAKVPADSSETADKGNDASKEEANKIVAMTTLADEDRGESVTTVTTTRGPEDQSEKSGLLKLPGRSKKTTTVTTTITEETEAPQTSTSVTETTKSEMQLKLEEARKAEALRFSTDEKPEFSEFEWCYGQYGLIKEQPDDVKALTVWDQWVGGWKGFIVHTPADAKDKFSREVNNVDISIVEDKVTATVKHHLYEVDGEVFDDSVTADFVLKGDVDGYGIDVQGKQHMIISCFWKQDGHEYALGEITDEDGRQSYIALMR